jgi:hypothetical protein
MPADLPNLTSEKIRFGNFTCGHFRGFGSVFPMGAASVAVIPLQTKTTKSNAIRKRQSARNCDSPA